MGEVHVVGARLLQSAHGGESQNEIVKYILRKLALVPSELELLRSHPKDERGEFEGGWAACPVWANPHFCELSPKVRWFLISCSDAPFSAPSGDPRGESFWSHFGDILESILETFWSPFWNGKLTCRAPKGSSPTPAYCCIAVSGLPGFCTGGTRTLPFLPTQRIASQVTPQRVANLLRALLLVGASNHVKRCPADHRTATDTLRTLSSRR